jgi:hypothetical protein
MVVSFSSLLTAVVEMSSIPLPEFLTHCRITIHVESIPYTVPLIHTLMHIFIEEKQALIHIITKLHVPQNAGNLSS